MVTRPTLRWTPKAYKERKVPSKLVKRLKAWKAKADKNFDWYSRLLAAIRNWIFSTA